MHIFPTSRIPDSMATKLVIHSTILLSCCLCQPYICFRVFFIHFFITWVILFEKRGTHIHMDENDISPVRFLVWNMNSRLSPLRGGAGVKRGVYTSWFEWKFNNRRNHFSWYSLGEWAPVHSCSQKMDMSRDKRTEALRSYLSYSCKVQETEERRSVKKCWRLFQENVVHEVAWDSTIAWLMHLKKEEAYRIEMRCQKVLHDCKHWSPFRPVCVFFVAVKRGYLKVRSFMYTSCTTYLLQRIEGHKLEFCFATQRRSIHGYHSWDMPPGLHFPSSSCLSSALEDVVPRHGCMPEWGLKTFSRKKRRGPGKNIRTN